MQSLCTSLASKEGAVISPAANAALGGVTCPPFLLPLSRSLRASLKPPPASCDASPALSYVALLSSFLSRACIHVRMYDAVYVYKYARRAIPPRRPPSTEYDEALRHALIFRLYAIISQQP